MRIVSIIAAIVLVSVAHAGNFENAPILKEAIRYNDLDLATPAGIQGLYGRIQRAAMHVCGEYYDGTTELREKMAVKTCKAAAIRQAVLKIGNAALIRYYEDRAGQGTRLAAR